MDGENFSWRKLWMMGERFGVASDALCRLEGWMSGSGRRVAVVEGTGLYPVGRLAMESLIEAAW